MASSSQGTNTVQADNNEESKMRAIPIRDAIREGYSLATAAQAELIHFESRIDNCSTKQWQGVNAPFRLKNGFVDKNGMVSREYYSGLENKLITKSTTPTSVDKDDQLTEADRLIALAYAVEHDDVDDEIEKLIGDEKVLSTRLSSCVGNGTVLHLCAYFVSNQALAKVLKRYPHCVNSGILDESEETPLHNLAYSEGSYDKVKEAADLLLRHAPETNNFLSANMSPSTALHTAFELDAANVSNALLDASREIQQKKGESPSWLQSLVV